MIFDDHDVTDDFFLSPIWRDRVLEHRRSARRSCGNGDARLRAVPGLGQRPAALRQPGCRTELLHPGDRAVPAPAQQGRPGEGSRPTGSPAVRLDMLFGHDLRNVPDGGGEFRRVDPPITLALQGRRARSTASIALDNRTRRSYPSRARPARQRVGRRARSTRSRRRRCRPGSELLVVDRAAAGDRPAGHRRARRARPSTGSSTWSARARSDDVRPRPDSLTGLRQMTGTNPDAIETWALDAAGVRAAARTARSRTGGWCCCRATCTTRPAPR